MIFLVTPSGHFFYGFKMGHLYTGTVIEKLSSGIFVLSDRAFPYESVDVWIEEYIDVSN